MKLYLVRHGVAHEHGDPAFARDEDRTLTLKGRKQFRRAAAGLLEIVDPPAFILTSPLPRAIETAAILQDEAASAAQMRVCEGMRPGGSFDQVVRDCAAQIEAATGSDDQAANPVVERGIALVGHAPSIGLLAAWLLNGDAAGFTLTIGKGGIACIAFEQLPAAGQGDLEFLVTPRLLRKLAP